MASPASASASVPLRRPTALSPPANSPTPPGAGPSRRQTAPHFSDLPPSSPSPQSKTTPARAALTRRASGLSASANAEQRRARREQLRNFYGLKGDGVKEDDVGAGASQLDKTGDPLDMNSSAFNAATYYEDLISKSSLSGLLKTASALSSEIGNLQSSRHALVYNHHHQLFAAGDTISHLNSRTPQLLGIMTNLQQSFSEISRLSDSVALSDEPKTALDELARIRIGVERLRLMVLSEETPEKVKDCYTTFEPEITRLSADGREEAIHLEAECKSILSTLPPEAVAAPGDIPVSGS